ncbi:MAG: protein kinase, partial [bacterium]
MIDKTISYYKILEKLGEGGMGVVYKARDTKLDRFVALKFLPPHLSQDEENKKRFMHEAKAASALDHPNICTIHEIDETEDGQMFIAMACYEGECLKERIEGGPLPLEEAVDISIQIAEGLAKAHSKAITHRDIKPANILITEDRQVKIVDFGLAKLAGRTQLTKEGTTLGTVAYMSPEQTHGAKVDRRTDIWALGVVLYEMITGQRPFRGDYEQAVIYSILNEEPELLASVKQQVPIELEQVVEKTLQKEPDNRYQTMDELQADLHKVGSILSEPHKSGFEKIQKGRPKASLNLPVPLTSFVGRKTEINEIQSLLTKSRLLTLTGPGGTGKTRLCIQAAKEWLSEFVDGIIFVALANISDAELVGPTIAHTLGIRIMGDVPIMDKIEHFLRNRHALLILDNFEHVISAAPLVGELLENCPELKILVTSREPLHVIGEHEFPVGPLNYPESKAIPAGEVLSSYEAIDLFVQRAQAIKPDFSLSSENAAAIIEICNRLDGLPLAIELAAARTKLFSPQAIQKRLGNKLHLLSA